MAPSLAPPMTPSPRATPTKRPQRMVPIIPAIPRSLEKRKLKEDVKSSKDEGATGSPIRPTSPGGEESQVETAVAQTEAVQNGAFNDSDVKYDQENGLQEPVAEPTKSAGSEKEVGTAEGKSTFQSILV